jgi:soluble lytic murein transglycosylase-like protein
MIVISVLLILTGVLVMNDARADGLAVAPMYQKYDHLFKKYASKYGLNWKFLRRIAWIESRVGNDPRTSKGLVSYDGLSWGLMQIAEGVGSPKEIELKGFGGADKLNDPEYSIDVACRLISYLKSKKGYTEKDIVQSYNQGEKNQDRMRELERQGKLLSTQYLAAQDYWKKYQQAIKEVG